MTRKRLSGRRGIALLTQPVPQLTFPSAGFPAARVPRERALRLGGPIKRAVGPTGPAHKQRGASVPAGLPTATVGPSLVVFSAGFGHPVFVHALHQRSPVCHVLCHTPPRGAGPPLWAWLSAVAYLDSSKARPLTFSPRSPIYCTLARRTKKDTENFLTSGVSCVIVDRRSKRTQRLANMPEWRNWQTPGT